MLCSDCDSDAEQERENSGPAENLSMDLISLCLGISNYHKLSLLSRTVGLTMIVT